MLSHQRIYAILLLCLLPLAVVAQERLTLEDAIARALQYNYDIQVVRATAQQAAVNNTAGNAGMLPNVNLGGTVLAGSATTRIEFADGRVQDVANAGTLQYGGAAMVDWILFDGGGMFIRKRQLNELQAIGEVQLKEQVQATVSQVVQAYAQAVFQKQQGVAIDSALSLAKVRMVLSQLKFETGSSAKVDFLQARADYNARQSDSLSQEAALTAAFADLNLLMGSDAYASYAIDDSLTLNTALQPTERERLQSMNFTLDIARRQAVVSKLGYDNARANMLPTLSFNGAYNYNRTQSQAGFALFNRSYGPQGALNLLVPVFQGGNLRRVSKVAGLQALRDQLLYEKQNTELGRQYRTAWRNYETAVAAYNLEKQNIGFAKENLDIQKARFRVGIATTLETREAENSYVQALIRLYTAAYNLKVNETLVLELEGQLVK